MTRPDRHRGNYDDSKLASEIAAAEGWAFVRERQGLLRGGLEDLGFETCRELAAASEKIVVPVRPARSDQSTRAFAN